LVTDGFPGPKGRVGHPDPTHFIGQNRPGRHVTGIEWIFIVLALLIDLGSYGQGRRAQAARA
jgi:hypothetical protein